MGDVVKIYTYFFSSGKKKNILISVNKLVDNYVVECIHAS